MRIEVSSRRGRFNFCNLQEETISTHIAIINNDGKKEMYCNIRTEYEITDESSMNILEVLDDFIAKIFVNTDSDNIKSIRKYVYEHQDELDEGNARYELETLQKQKDRIEERIASVKRRLPHSIEKGGL